MLGVRDLFIRPAGAAPSGIQYFEPNLRAMYANNYENYDAGWRIANGVWVKTPKANPAVIQQLDPDAADPYNTLLHNNLYGNKFRYTRDDGSQTAPTAAGDIVIDHLTCREYRRNDVNYRNFTAAIGLHQGIGFYALSEEEYWSLSEFDNNNITLIGQNFSVSTQQPWTCNNEPGDNTRAIICNNNSFPIVSTAKTNTRRTGIYVRIWDEVI